MEYRHGVQALLAARRPTTSGQNQWHVAYVHLPKTGGSSIGAALAAGGAAACAHKTHNLKELGMCDCAHRDCLQKSQAAVVERPGVLSRLQKNPSVNLRSAEAARQSVWQRQSAGGS